MSKKNRWLTIDRAITLYLLAVLIFIVLGGFMYYKYRTSPISSIAMNWDIELPYTNEQLYEYEEPSFLGDGLRYHVLKYSDNTRKDKNKIGKIIKLIQDNENIPNTQEINGWLEEILVPTSMYPNYDCCMSAYFVSKKDHRNEMYLLFDKHTGILYIIESFF